MGKAECRLRIPAAERFQQPTCCAFEPTVVGQLRSQGDGAGSPRADRHDLDAGGGAARRSGDQHRGADAGEWIQHGAGAGAQRVADQLRGEPLLVLEPAQPGLLLVRLVRHQAAIQIAPHDQAVAEPLPQCLPRRAVVVRLSGSIQADAWIDADHGRPPNPAPAWRWR